MSAISDCLSWQTHINSWCLLCVSRFLNWQGVCRVTSRFRGVRWHYCNSRWEARIFNGTRQVSLGYFDNEVEAAAAYDAQAWKMRGAAAVLNFPADGNKSSRESEVNDPSEVFPADSKTDIHIEGGACSYCTPNCYSTEAAGRRRRIVSVLAEKMLHYPYRHHELLKCC